jgi:hypothetical protein
LFLHTPFLAIVKRNGHNFYILGPSRTNIFIIHRSLALKQEIYTNWLSWVAQASKYFFNIPFLKKNTIFSSGRPCWIWVRCFCLKFVFFTQHLMALWKRNWHKLYIKGPSGTKVFVKYAIFHWQFTFYGMRGEVVEGKTCLNDKMMLIWWPG